MKDYKYTESTKKSIDRPSSLLLKDTFSSIHKIKTA